MHIFLYYTPTISSPGFGHSFLTLFSQVVRPSTPGDRTPLRITFFTNLEFVSRLLMVLGTGLSLLVVDENHPVSSYSNCLSSDIVGVTMQLENFVTVMLI